MQYEEPIADLLLPELPAVSNGTSFAKHEAEPVRRGWAGAHALPRTLLLRSLRRWILAVSTFVTIFGIGHTGAADVRSVDLQQDGTQQSAAQDVEPGKTYLDSIHIDTTLDEPMRAEAIRGTIPVVDRPAGGP